MASQVNILKLRRLTSTLSPSLSPRNRYSTIDPEYTSSPFKLPAINSINKAVKNNDISFSYPRAPPKLRPQPNSQDTLGESLAHSSLVTVRKRYNAINKDRENEQNKIKLLQIEKEKFMIEKDKYQKLRLEAGDKAKTLDKDLQSIKYQFNEADMQRKVFLHISQRLKSDKFIDKKRKKEKMDQYQFLQKQRELLLKEWEKIKLQNSRGRKVMKHMMEHLNEDGKNMEGHIYNIQHLIQNRVKAYHGSGVHKVEMKEIAEHTQSQKQPKQRQWHHLYLSQRLLQTLLRTKLTKEIKMFQDVENAYKKIKTQTGVDSAQLLVNKYLNRQQSYGYLLSAIASQEKEIIELKNQRDELYRQSQKLKAEEQTLNINKKEEIDLSKQEKDYNIVNEKLSKCYIFKQIIQFWLTRNLKKITNQEKLKHQQQNVIEDFGKYLKLLIKEIENVEQYQEDNFKNEGVNEDNNTRIWRGEELLKRKQTASSNNQEEHVEEIRLQTLKSNQKFMNTLKQKYEQIKKQRIQAQARRKEAKMN